MTEDSTQESLTVSWERGYNGGADQWFVITYYETIDGTELQSGNITERENGSLYTHIVGGLNPGLRYGVSLYSGNKLGPSSDVKIVVGITTRE